LLLENTSCWRDEGKKYVIKLSKALDEELDEDVELFSSQEDTEIDPDVLLQSARLSIHSQSGCSIEGNLFEKIYLNPLN
jgi:hypothetical protein